MIKFIKSMIRTCIEITHFTLYFIGYSAAVLVVNPLYMVSYRFIEYYSNVKNAYKIKKAMNNYQK